MFASLKCEDGMTILSIDCIAYNTNNCTIVKPAAWLDVHALAVVNTCKNMGNLMLPVEPITRLKSLLEKPSSTHCYTCIF